MGTSSRWVTSAAVLLGLGVATPGWAFSQLSQFGGSASPIVYNHWDPDQLPIHYRVDPGGSGIAGVDAVALVQAAFGAWENVTSSAIRFEYDGFIPDTNGDNNTTIADIDSGAAFRDDGRIDVIFDDSGAYFDRQFGPDNGVLGLAFPTIDINTGRMRDSDIVISVPNVKKFSDIDLLGVLTHEIGHLCGLGHSGVFPDVGFNQIPTMFPYAGVYGPDRTEQRSLSADDAAGVSYLYPESSLAHDFGTIRGTITQADGQPGFGTHVTALNAATGEAVGAIAGYFSGNTHDGTYFIPGVPPGLYAVFIHALDGGQASGFVSGFNISEILRQTLGFSFPKEYFNNVADQPAATGINVAAASTTTGVDFVQGSENGGAPLATHVTTTPDSGSSGHHGGGGGGCAVAESSPAPAAAALALLLPGLWVVSRRRRG